MPSEHPRPHAHTIQPPPPPHTHTHNQVTIIDVLEPRRCECRDKDSGQILDLRQRMLETTIPRGDKGGRVCVVAGRHRGCKGTVMAKVKRSGRSPKMTVHLDDSDVIKDFYYDDVCAFVESA